MRARTLMISDSSWLISAWKAKVSVSSAMVAVCGPDECSGTRVGESDRRARERLTFSETPARQFITDPSVRNEKEPRRSLAKGVSPTPGCPSVSLSSSLFRSLVSLEPATGLPMGYSHDSPSIRARGAGKGPSKKDTRRAKVCPSTTPPTPTQDRLSLCDDSVVTRLQSGLVSFFHEHQASFSSITQKSTVYDEWRE